MTENARYYGKTAALSLVGCPALVAVASGIGTFMARDGGVTGSAVVAGFLALAVQFPTWFLLGRKPTVPEGWRAFLPVVLPQLWFLLAWAVTFLATAFAYGDSLPVAAVTHFPYLFLVAAIVFVGAPEAMPAVLVASALGTVGGFALGHLSRSARTAERRWGVGAVATTLVLSLLIGVEAWHARSVADLLKQGTAVSQEVDLLEYRPFWEGTKLVSPDQRPALRISSDYPVLDGATAAYPIYAAMGQAIYVPPAGVDETGLSEFVDTYLNCTNTAGGYQRLIGGEADVFFGAQPSKGIRERAKAAGRELKLTPIGREAFVVFVKADNPVSGLTTKQIQDIYTRRVTNWSQVGGADEAITPFQRPPDSGSQTVMEAKVMQGQPMATPLKEESISGMGGIVSQVADFRTTSAAIGYSFRWYATVMNGNPGIKLLAVDGVQPTVDNIRNGTYPFTIDVYAVTAGTTNPNAQALVDWAVSDEGQALIEKVGYVGRS